jgi:hypothetical protein
MRKSVPHWPMRKELRRKHKPLPCDVRRQLRGRRLAFLWTALVSRYLFVKATSSGTHRVGLTTSLLPLNIYVSDCVDELSRLLKPPSFPFASLAPEDPYNPLWLFLEEHFSELWRLGNGFAEFIQWLIQYLQRRRHEPPTEVPVH